MNVNKGEATNAKLRTEVEGKVAQRFGYAVMSLPARVANAIEANDGKITQKELILLSSSAFLSLFGISETQEALSRESGYEATAKQVRETASAYLNGAGKPNAVRVLAFRDAVATRCRKNGDPRAILEGMLAVFAMSLCEMNGAFWNKE